MSTYLRTLPTFAHTYERCIIIYLSVNTTTIGTAPTSCSMFAQMFQRLSCGFYALDPYLACSKFAQMFQRLSCGFYALYPSLACYVCSDVSDALLRVLCTLSVSRLFKAAWDILPGCALRLDGKAWPHPQTARLTLTVHCGHTLSIENRDQQ